MNKATILFAAMTLVALGATDARASDNKTMSALTCVRRSGGVGVVDSQGRLQNDGTTQMIVTCPLVRDYTQETLGFVTVSVLDATDPADVWCRTASVSQTTNGVISWGAKDYSTGVDLNDYQRLGLPIPASYDLGAFILECGVPAANATNGSSMIVSWYYGEG